MVYFHNRLADKQAPAGITVSRSEELIDDIFAITEYVWGDVSLWFVDSDNFTADEREAAYIAFLGMAGEQE